VKALFAMSLLLAAPSVHAAGYGARDQQLVLAVLAVLLGFVCSLWWKRGRR
jgi:hypothetical protein